VGPQYITDQDKKVENWIKRHKEQIKWLDELIALSPDGTGLRGFYNAYGGVQNKAGDKVDILDSDSIGMHVICWELAGKPSWQWLDEKGVHNSDDDYLPPFRNYAEQFFNWDEFIANEPEDVLKLVLDPLMPGGEASKDRILAEIRKIGGPFVSERKAKLIPKKAAKPLKKGFVKSPITGKAIKVGGELYNKLVSEGKITIDTPSIASSSTNTALDTINRENVLITVDTDKSKAQYYVITGNFNINEETMIELQQRLEEVDDVILAFYSNNNSGYHSEFGGEKATTAYEKAYSVQTNNLLGNVAICLTNNRAYAVHEILVEVLDLGADTEPSYSGTINSEGVLFRFETY